MQGVETAKFPASQMAWGIISSKEVGRLKFVRGNVNASVYADILKDCLKPTI